MDTIEHPKEVKQLKAGKYYCQSATLIYYP